MLEGTLAKVFGTKHEREIKAIRPLVAAISALEPQLQKLSDSELAAKTPDFKQRLANGASLDDILVEAFAVCRETGRRVLNMRHFDVQLIGGVVLHRGRIAEMKTGEGKTLVATLPSYLNGLAGKGVHVVTVNDYLARRDSEWMGQIHRFLGLTVGNIVHDLDERERRVAYNSDITYGTNNEFGFDYLRDNMKFRLEDYVQRDFNFAIVDEVDSILIDEARTPLIIAGPSEESTDKYYKVNRIIPFLERGEIIEGKEPGQSHTTGDFTVDEKHRTSALTEPGVLKIEKLLDSGNLYDAGNLELNHHVQQALRAHILYQRDRDYVVQEGQVIIVDEFTGRLMPGRRWSDGLHQAVEAKENVKIERETQTMASITFQNFFRMYKKLSGMTGTADTEAAEFGKIYNLDVTVIPTNKTMVRTEYTDVVYRTEDEKFRNAAKEIKELHEKGQPVLVGTISVEKSERLSGILKKMGVRHEVLNAKNHEREAHIVAQAGRKAAVTVSTNMAGRGTDILLGGNVDFLLDDRLRKSGRTAELVPAAELELLKEQIKKEVEVERAEVVAAGGLHILGTERHESRRIDNQLRGRAGRQGDPGSSRFYLSLQDDLLRIFGGERMQNLMLRLGMEEDVPIESGLITKRIAAAQKAVEAQHFASRKHVLEYDDVMNKQRQAVYGMRRQLLEGSNQRDRILEIVRGIVGSFVDQFLPENARVDQYDLTGLQNAVLNQFGAKIEVAELGGLSRSEVEQHVKDQLLGRYEEKERMIGEDNLRQAERIIMLNVVDNQWKDHLLSMDHLKEGIGLRGYGQKDPLVEYKKESFTMFQDMMDRIEDETLKYLYFMRIEVGAPPPVPYPELMDEEEEEEEEEAEEQDRSIPSPAEIAAKQREAQQAVVDLTRNIQRKKDRELSQLQFTGGENSTDASQTEEWPEGWAQRIVPLRERKEVQEMSRSRSLIVASLLTAASFAAVDHDGAIWSEYGLVHTESGTRARSNGALTYTAYRMKDLTGALAAWEWQRSPQGTSCEQAAYCTRDGNRTVIFDDNYVVVFNDPAPKKADVDGVLEGLPNRRDGALPAILTFLPRQGLVRDSARYLLGAASLSSFAGEIGTTDPGFAAGAEGQAAEYKLPGASTPVRLAVFYYPAPEAARLHVTSFKLIPNTFVKRSGVLLAVVYGGATQQQADTLLSRVQYEAKITWNDSPPPGPIKPLYALLLNIIYMSVLLTSLCLVGGLIYAGMRIYRRRYGQLDSQEAMTTLHLSGD